MDNTGETILTGRQTVQDLHYALRTTIRGLETTVDNLNRLSESLSEDPSRLLFGSPPEPRALPK